MALGAGWPFKAPHLFACLPERGSSGLLEFAVDWGRPPLRRWQLAIHQWRFTVSWRAGVGRPSGAAARLLQPPRTLSITRPHPRPQEAGARLERSTLPSRWMALCNRGQPSRGPIHTDHWRSVMWLFWTYQSLLCSRSRTLAFLVLPSWPSPDAFRVSVHASSQPRVPTGTASAVHSREPPLKQRGHQPIATTLSVTTSSHKSSVRCMLHECCAQGALLHLIFDHCGWSQYQKMHSR